MTDEFEKTLQSALRRHSPGGDFSARVAARLDSRRRGVFRSRWLPAALAACIIAAIGVLQTHQHALDAARANEARAQLLSALSIASDNVNIVRAAVAREENPNS
jgi:7-keto-8-aminopelargonate synthetase-like enzyme